MAESSLNLVLRLRDEATAGLRQFREGLERTGDAVKKSQREFRRANEKIVRGVNDLFPDIACRPRRRRTHVIDRELVIRAART